jgi:GxxExxY protein
MLTRVTPALPEDLEALMRQTIGCCLVVHRELGCGLSESVYMRARRVELQRAGLHCESEKPVPVMYRGGLLCHQRLDFLVEQRVVLEIKSVERILRIHVAQTVSYLRLSGLRAGLLINFNVRLLAEGIRRVVL